MKLSEKDIDFYSEFTSICVGHAANRMAQLLPYPLWINPPAVSLHHPSAINDPQNINFVFPLISIPIDGDVPAIIFMSFSAIARSLLKEKFLPMMGGPEAWNAVMENSMILEIGNIMSSAWTTAAEQVSGLLLMPRIPEILSTFSLDRFRAIQNGGCNAPLVVMKTDILTMAPHQLIAGFCTILSTEQAQRISLAAERGW